VDVDNATYSNSVGSVELKTVWTDPEFDPAVHAFYYARVLEIPTPRWTTIQAHQLGIAPPDVVPPTVQERAWSSPIWYTPSAEARQNVKPGLTTADLIRQGAKALTNEQLKTLLVGKAVWVRNTVTGEQFKTSYTAGGQKIVWYVGRNGLLPSYSGNIAKNGYEGVTTPYAIENGNLVTMLSEAPSADVVYKMGDTYYIARSSEFGFANYEILAKPPQLLNPLANGESKQEGSAK
jgi:hypothetical protein